MTNAVDFDTGKPLQISKLDAGVRKVVAELISMGAVPIASCDGHGNPESWYVLFDASQELAQRITDRGHFTVALVMHQPGRYRMDRNRQPKWVTTVSLVKGWLANAC